MYNPYTSTPHPNRDGAQPKTDSKAGVGRGQSRNPLSGLLGLFGAEQKDAGMTGILKKLHLQDIDSGDVLLLLIILLLVLEGDEMEMVVTLGLLLLMGLGDGEKENQV